eukprot:5601797-Prymnesium_polylepis.1
MCCPTSTPDVSCRLPFFTHSTGHVSCGRILAGRREAELFELARRAPVWRGALASARQRGFRAHAHAGFNFMKSAAVEKLRIFPFRVRDFGCAPSSKRRLRCWRE